MPRFDCLKPVAVIIALIAPVASPALAQDKAVPKSQIEMQLSFAPLVKQARGAVVNVYAERLVQTRSSLFAGDPF
ncbi:MAG: serine protease, partial [Allorhizobium sp.]